MCPLLFRTSTLASNQCIPLMIYFLSGHPSAFEAPETTWNFYNLTLQQINSNPGHIFCFFSKARISSFSCGNQICTQDSRYFLTKVLYAATRLCNALTYERPMAPLPLYPLMLMLSVHQCSWHSWHLLYTPCLHLTSQNCMFNSICYLSAKFSTVFDNFPCDSQHLSSANLNSLSTLPFKSLIILNIDSCRTLLPIWNKYPSSTITSMVSFGYNVPVLTGSEHSFLMLYWGLYRQHPLHHLLIFWVITYFRRAV